MARRRRACPTLFCISDNGLSISFKTRGWAEAWAEQRLGMRVFRADGTSLPQAWGLLTLTLALALTLPLPLPLPLHCPYS